MNSAKALAVIRVILLLLIAAFIILTGYRMWIGRTFEWTTIVPILGLLLFYVITRPKGDTGGKA